MTCLRRKSRMAYTPSQWHTLLQIGRTLSKEEVVRSLPKHVVNVAESCRTTKWTRNQYSWKWQPSLMCPPASRSRVMCCVTGRSIMCTSNIPNNATHAHTHNLLAMEAWIIRNTTGMLKVMNVNNVRKNYETACNLNTFSLLVH